MFSHIPHFIISEELSIGTNVLALFPLTFLPGEMDCILQLAHIRLGHIELRFSLYRRPSCNRHEFTNFGCAMNSFESSSTLGMTTSAPEQSEWNGNSMSKVQHQEAHFPNTDTVIHSTMLVS
jgi:hypothetical protein